MLAAIPPQRIAALLLCTLFLLNLTSMFNKTITYDEDIHYEFGYRLIEGEVTTPDEQRMPISALNALPLWLLSGGSDERRQVPTTPVAVTVARLPTVFASLLLGFFVYRFAVALYGGRAGVLALTLYTFSPNVLASSRLAGTDLYATAGILIALYCLYGYLNRPTWGWLVATGASLGVAQICKQTSLLLLPIFALIGSGVWLLARGESGRDMRPAAFQQGVKTWVAHLSVLGLLILAIVNAGYGFYGSFDPLGRYADSPGVVGEIAQLAPALPVPLPSVYVETFLRGASINQSGEGREEAYLFGEFSALGWWYYFPIALGLKVPLGFLALVGLAIASVVRERGSRLNRDLQLLIPVAFLFVFISLFVTAQIGVRYLLPILPLLHVFIGRLAGDEPPHLPSHAASHPTPAKPRWQGPAVGLSLFWFVVSSLSFHPHYLSYFNELIGDRKNMYLYLADSNVDWGQNGRYLDRYLAQHADEQISYAPTEPVAGRVVVGVNDLIGLERERERYRWLRENFEPVDHIAYSLLVFDVPVERAALLRAEGQPMQAGENESSE